MYIKSIALGLALTLSTAATQAATLVDNINIAPAGLDWGANGISNIDNWSMSTPWTPLGPIAESFFAPTATTLTSVTLRLSRMTEADGPLDSIMVYLVPDDGSNGFSTAGSPTNNGLSGASFAFTGATLIGSIAESLIGDEPANYTLFTSLSISAGEHWIAAVAPDTSTVMWWYNYAGVTDAIGSAGQAGFDQFSGRFDFGDGAYEMIVAAPEPASLAILGAALAGVGYFSRRRRTA